MLNVNETITTLKNMNEILENLYIGIAAKEKSLLFETKPAPYGIDDIVQHLYVNVNDSQIIIPKGAYGINTDMLWNTALENTKRESKTFKFDAGMFTVITNNSGIKGASSIVNEELMQNISKKEHTNKFVLLPSSIHEVLLIPVIGIMSKEDMDRYNTMVKEVNTQVVSKNERLSDHAYYIEI